MPYQLKQFRRSVKRQLRTQRTLRTLPARVQQETVQIILELQSDPYPPISEELRDQYRGVYKIKVDGYRIFYRVNDTEKAIDIVNVKRRDPNTYTGLYTLLF